MINHSIFYELRDWQIAKSGQRKKKITIAYRYTVWSAYS
jgi:hypothetical protein